MKGESESMQHSLTDKGRGSVKSVPREERRMLNNYKDDQDNANANYIDYDNDKNHHNEEKKDREKWNTGLIRITFNFNITDFSTFKHES